LALGFWTIAASASVSLGPTVGGYLIDHFSWHTIFDVNVPVGIFGMIASFVILRERKSEEGRFFDLVGFLSLSIFLTALILALANGNSAWNTGGWTSGFILACFAFSIVGLAVFLVAEFNVRHPLIELVLFKSLDFTLSNIALFIFGLGMFGSTFLLPIYLQNSLGYTPFQAGLVFLPVGIITGITAPFAGYYSDKHNAKIPVIIGLALFALSFYQYSYLSFLSEKEQIMLPLYIRGVAMGFVFSPLTKIAITEISNQKMAQASGLINVIRQIGGSFGVAIFGTILTRRTIFHSAMYSQQLDTNSEAFRNSIVKLQHFVMQTGGGSASGAMAKAKGLLYSFAQNQAFIQAVDDVFFMAAIIILISLVPIFFLRVNHQIDARKIAATD
jgi:MFS transporter, DHA2 family, multidrug resistance protein